MGPCPGINSISFPRGHNLFFTDSIRSLKLPPGKSLRGMVREDFEIVRIKTDVLKSDLIIKVN